MRRRAPATTACDAWIVVRSNGLVTLTEWFIVLDGRDVKVTDLRHVERLPFG